MGNSLIENIVKDFKDHGSSVLRVENNDRFLYREDLQAALKESGFSISIGSNLKHRIDFELREPEDRLLLLSQDNTSYLEDIKLKSFPLEWNLGFYLNNLHIPSVINEPLDILEKIFVKQIFKKHSRRETEQLIAELKSMAPYIKPFDLENFENQVKQDLSEENINWGVVIRRCSDAVKETIGTEAFTAVYNSIGEINTSFQDYLGISYSQIKNASAVKKPKIVSKILDHLAFSYQDKKVALIVIDGLSWWQYGMLKEVLPAKITDDVMFSWIPSITQLSRQAIFRGSTPLPEYKQSPQSEEKLWKDFWKSKGTNEFEIEYLHQNFKEDRLHVLSKLAIVYKDLDEKMHASTDYHDLKGLTENWIQRSNIRNDVQKLLENGFTVFLTSDHGNIQAQGWRNLTGREKLGTNKSGSRSQRHLEYTEQWLIDQLLSDNPGLTEHVVKENQALYFKNNFSFSSASSLVTHGGAHILEVLIPFVKISNEK